MVDVSVIVVSFNTKTLLARCVRSVKLSQDVSCETLVIDNASSDGSVEMIRTDYPTVKLIVNKENRGFAFANNQGLTKAIGRYMLLLNSDATVESDTFAKLMHYMDAHREVGIVGCQIHDEKGEVQFSAGYYPTLWRVFQWMLFLDDLGLKYVTRQYHVEYSRFFCKEQDVDWVQGACFMINRRVYEKIGGLDEAIFMYGEDVEYARRARGAGFAVRYIPQPIIFHLGQGSSQGKSTRALIGEYKGLLTIYSKYHSPSDRTLLSILLQLGAALRFFVFGVVGGRKEARDVYGTCFTLA